jgi:hypothetical protein
MDRVTIPLARGLVDSRQSAVGTAFPPNPQPQCRSIRCKWTLHRDLQGARFIGRPGEAGTRPGVYAGLADDRGRFAVSPVHRARANHGSPVHRGSEKGTSLVFRCFAGKVKGVGCLCSASAPIADPAYPFRAGSAVRRDFRPLAPPRFLSVGPTACTLSIVY